MLDRELRNWNISQSQTQTDLPSASGTHSLTSQTPTIYDVKIVCDGAFKASIQRGAYGVIKYDVEGRVVDGRARNFCCRAPICAEAFGLLAAVEMASRDTRSTIILSDCLNLVSVIHEGPEKWPWEAASVIAMIQQVLNSSNHITVIHARRTEIQAADRIAKQARDDLLPVSWLSDL
ncbi:hypothetical protein LINPERHAP1_LOCUS20691 [Linum perenne]